ncbi:hypothetical protein F442_08645, partial [Phytophthora nicotianae P10297]
MTKEQSKILEQGAPFTLGIDTDCRAIHNDALVLHHVRDNLRRIEKHSTMSKYLAAGADIIKVAGFEKACEV